MFVPLINAVAVLLIFISVHFVNNFFNPSSPLEILVIFRLAVDYKFKLSKESRDIFIEVCFTECFIVISYNLIYLYSFIIYLFVPSFFSSLKYLFYSPICVLLFMYVCVLCILFSADITGFPVSQTSAQLLHLRSLLKGSPIYMFI